MSTSNADLVEKMPTRERDLTVRRRRPLRRPTHDYYYEDYYDDDYDRTRFRGHSRRDYYDYEDRKYQKDHDRDFRGFRDRDRSQYFSSVNRRDQVKMKETITVQPLTTEIYDQKQIKDEKRHEIISFKKKHLDKR